MTDPLEAQALELIGLAERVPMPEWHYEGLNDDALKYGAFVHTGMWGAVCICPKESPQYSAHLTNMKYIAAASPMKVAPIARAYLEAGAEIERLRKIEKAAVAYRLEDSEDTPRMWKGKKLHELAMALDAALHPETGAK